jgi:hypothetical protein
MPGIHDLAYLAGLVWHLPKDLQNEPVEYAFAADADGVYRRVRDPVAHSVTYSFAPWEQVYCDWRPWLTRPEVNEWASVPGGNAPH